MASKTLRAYLKSNGASDFDSGISSTGDRSRFVQLTAKSDREFIVRFFAAVYFDTPIVDSIVKPFIPALVEAVDADVDGIVETLEETFGRLASELYAPILIDCMRRVGRAIFARNSALTLDHINQFLKVSSDRAPSFWRALLLEEVASFCSLYCQYQNVWVEHLDDNYELVCQILLERGLLQDGVLLSWIAKYHDVRVDDFTMREVHEHLIRDFELLASVLHRSPDNAVRDLLDYHALKACSKASLAALQVYGLNNRSTAREPLLRNLGRKQA